MTGQTNESGAVHEFVGTIHFAPNSIMRTSDHVVQTLLGRRLLSKERIARRASCYQTSSQIASVKIIRSFRQQSHLFFLMMSP